MKKIMTIMVVALLSIGVVSAQTRLISGKVTDSKGTPVPGATVKAKSGKIGRASCRERVLVQV